jgi:hypothetical protein
VAGFAGSELELLQCVEWIGGHLLAFSGQRSAFSDQQMRNRQLWLTADG